MAVSTDDKVVVTINRARNANEKWCEEHIYACLWSPRYIGISTVLSFIHLYPFVSILNCLCLFINLIKLYGV